MPNIHISTSGALNLLTNLNPSKAPGPDSISPKVLKEMSCVLADPLPRLCRKSLSNGHIPTGFKHANVTAVFRKGQKYLCSSLKPSIYQFDM